MKDLQAIIDARAEKKLDAELKKLADVLHGKNGFLSMIDNLKNVKVTLGNETDDFRSAFWSRESFAFSEMKNKLLPEFLEAETKIFLQEIEDLKKRTSQLEEDTSNLFNQ